VHVTDRDRLNTLLLGLVVLEATYRSDPDAFGWREEPYEFIADVPAIDLLTGSAECREALESGRPLEDLLGRWESQRQAFLSRRASVLLY
jgi:uncharacterized protein YbbC (DUF1343 family)